MSKKLGLLFALVGLCALSLFLLSCGSSSSRPSGLLYVLTQGNNGVGNNVTSFAIDLGSGNLSLINSNASTCTTSGVSCGPPLDIVLDPTGATAFVLNQGVPCQQAPPPSLQCVLDQKGNPTFSIPPTIYPYSIGSDGSFSTPGTPILLGHPTSKTDTEDDADLGVAMVRDTAGQFLFEINQGSSPTLGVCPHAPDPTKEFDACPSISVFAMKPGSTTLTLTGNVCNGVPCPYRLSRIPTALSTVTFTPQGGTPQELLFVTSNNDPVLHNDNTVSVYAVASDGTLTEQIGSPYAITTTDPLSVQAVNTNPATQTNGGVFVYVGSQPTAAGALNIFEVCTVVNNNTCTQVDVNQSRLVPVTTPPPPSPGANPVAMLVDPTNQFLYIACYGSSQVFGYKINTTTGTLSSLTPTGSAPTGSQPVALALHPSVNSSGAFLYTSNSGASNISGFPVSTTTGSIGSSITVNSPSTPSGMAAR